MEAICCHRISAARASGLLCCIAKALGGGNTDKDGLLFDQLIEPATGTTHVHSCLGFPLTFDQQLVGVLTADALPPVSLNL